MTKYQNYVVRSRAQVCLTQTRESTVRRTEVIKMQSRELVHGKVSDMYKSTKQMGCKI